MTLLLFRVINPAGLAALIGVLTGLLDLQFVVGEQRANREGNDEVVGPRPRELWDSGIVHLT
jgi:hypothetical protein